MLFPEIGGNNVSKRESVFHQQPFDASQIPYRIDAVYTRLIISEWIYVFAQRFSYSTCQDVGVVPAASSIHLEEAKDTVSYILLKFSAEDSVVV
jgi:hypothetical protein